jgi:hypothetical protein
MFRQVALGAALLATGMVGTSMAAVVVTTGAGVLSVINVSETAPSQLTSAADTGFSQIPNAFRGVTVPGGIDDDGDPVVQTDLFTVTFSGETQCRDTAGAATGWCSLRIVATQGGTTIVFNPNGATNGVNIRDFAFDSNPTGISNADEWESHAITQSARLPTGTWVIRAQRAIEVTAGSTTFRLDDWNLNIVASP